MWCSLYVHCCSQYICMLSLVVFVWIVSSPNTCLLLEQGSSWNCLVNTLLGRLSLQHLRITLTSKTSGTLLVNYCHLCYHQWLEMRLKHNLQVSSHPLLKLPVHRGKPSFLLTLIAGVKMSEPNLQSQSWVPLKG